MAQQPERQGGNPVKPPCEKCGHRHRAPSNRKAAWQYQRGKTDYQEGRYAPPAAIYATRGAYHAGQSVARCEAEHPRSRKAKPPQQTG